MPRKRAIICGATALLAVLAIGGAEAAAPLQVRADVDRSEVFLGEAIRLRVTVEGEDKPGDCDVSGLTDFSVQRAGTQFLSINGRNSVAVSYLLKPRRSGQLTIPAIPVALGGREGRTQPIRIRVKEPAEVDDFRLRQTLSKARCYRGERVILNVTWYVRKNVSGPSLDLPVLDQEGFTFYLPEATDSRSTRHVGIALGRRAELQFEQGTGKLDGEEYTTFTFRLAMIPKRAGTFAVPKATMAFHEVRAYRRDVWGDRVPQYGRKLIIPSNALTFTVVEPPLEGRPAGYVGHVGQFQLEASAEPTEVNVGDPITLTIRVRGPEYLKDLELPPLKDQPALARDFRIPAERAEGSVDGDVKVFSQTLRATHESVTAIPAIELPYFDPEREEYRVARTEPIPLTVRPTRVVTAADAEGRQPTAARTELQALQEGIAHNYESLEVLDDQEYGLATIVTSPLWLCLIGLPPVAYAVLLVGVTLVRRRRADPHAILARRAYGDLARRLRQLEGGDTETCGQVLAALREYLGRKLRLPPGAVTYGDVRSRLSGLGVDGGTLDELRTLFDELEAGQYAGMSGQPPVGRALELAKRLERSVR